MQLIDKLIQMAKCETLWELWTWWRKGRGHGLYYKQKCILHI